MKNIIKLLVALPLSIGVSLASYAQEVDVNEITMDVVDNVREHKREMRNTKRSIISSYMLGKGDITKEELDAMKAERKAIKQELKALKESGDEAALTARLTELREAHKAKREELKAYISNHEDLAAVLDEHRKKVREQRQDRRERQQDKKDRKPRGE